MPTTVDGARQRWQVEAAYLMGYVEIFQPGEYAICDECCKPKPLATGYYVKSDGLDLIWLCQECK